LVRARAERRFFVVNRQELGEQFIVRAAAWPLERLDGFGQLDDAFEAALSDTERERAYDAWIERERALLHASTIADPLFLKALALTNPDFAARAAAFDPAAPRNKRVRHLETTLFRYLSRAVTRTTPCDLWAGVTLGTFGEHTELREARTLRRFAPDLRPLVTLLETVVMRPAPGRRYCLNVTARASSSAIEYLTPESQLLRIEAAAPAELLAALGTCGAAPFEDFVASYARLVPTASEEQATTAIRYFVEVALLQPTRGFPNRFSDAWQALADAEQLLTEHEGAIWRRLVTELRAHCDRLARDFEALTALDVVSILERCRDALEAAANGYGVSLTLPRTPLRVDLVHGYELVLDPRARQTLLEAVEEYRRYQAALGPGAPLLESSRRAAARALGDARNLAAVTAPHVLTGALTSAFTWEELASALATPGPLLARLRRFAAVLDTESEEVVLRAEPAADSAGLGSLTALFVSLELSPERATLRAFTGEAPHAHTLHGRFAAALAERAEAAALTRWLREHFARASRPDRIFVELAAPAGALPNAWARADMGLPLLDMWRAEASDIDARDIEFHDGEPRLKRSLRGLVTCWLRSAAAVDVLTQTLAARAGCPLPQFHFEAAAIPTRGELERGSAPRLRLASGATVRSRRHFLKGADLRTLTAHRSKATRMRAWLALAEQQHWPHLVKVRRGHGPPLVIPTRSPLAVEALFEGLASPGERDYLAVEHLDGASFIDHAGGRFASELVLFNERLGAQPGEPRA
jgi:hypothetical protein